MKLTTDNPIVDKIGKIHLKGNIIPQSWFTNISYKITKSSKGKLTTSTKPYLEAIIILAEILYWYRPIEIRDEETGKLIGYKKKFRNDKLQRSYQSFANQFGLSRKQVREAISFLVKQNLIEIEFREITTESGTRLNNVLFLEPVPQAIINITYEVGKTLMTKSSIGSSRNQNEPPDEKGNTNTKITTKIITNFPSPLPSSQKKGKKDKRHSPKGKEGKRDEKLFEQLRSGIYRNDLFELYDNLADLDMPLERIVEEAAYKAIKSIFANNGDFLSSLGIYYHKVNLPSFVDKIKSRFPWRNFNSNKDKSRDFFVAAVCNTVTEVVLSNLLNNRIS